MPRIILDPMMANGLKCSTTSQVYVCVCDYISCYRLLCVRERESVCVRESVCERERVCVCVCCLLFVFVCCVVVCVVVFVVCVVLLCLFVVLLLYRKRK